MPNMSQNKVEMPVQEPNVRNKNFSEVALGYTEEMAIEEAQRCLNCKHRPCMGGCPVNVKIPEFIALVAEGKFEDAYHKIQETKLSPGGLRTRMSPREPVRKVLCSRYQGRTGRNRQT